MLGHYNHHQRPENGGFKPFANSKKMNGIQEAMGSIPIISTSKNKGFSDLLGSFFF